MAIKLGDALLMLGADDDKLKKDLGDAETKTKGWGATMTGVLQGIGQGAVGMIGGLISGAWDTFTESISLASDLTETVGKVRVIFGDAALAIEEWANGAATNLGITKQAALEAVGTLGNMFDQVGFGSEDAAQMSQNMVQLATDLGAFHNVDTAEVLEGIGAAFRGEYDSLQRYVPLINAAAVEQQALADTGKAAASELTAQEKAMAAYKLMIEGTATAHGNFKDTNDEWAGTMKTLNAYWTEFKTLLGETLLPILTPLLGKVKELASQYLPMLADYVRDEVIPAIEEWGAQFDGWWAEHAQPFIDSVQQMWDDVVSKVTEAMGDTDAEFGANTETLKATARVIGAEIGQALGSSIGSGVQTSWDAWWDDYWAGVRQRMEADPFLGPFLRWRDSMDPNPAPTTTAPTGGVQGEPIVNYQTHIPIVINAQGASANAVAQAANNGVAQALRAAGVTP